MYGVGEPLRGSNVSDFDQEKTTDLVEMLNAKSYRMWFGNDMFEGWRWNAPLDEFVISTSTKESYNKILSDLREAGVMEITGMGHYLPVVPSTVSDGMNYYVPVRGSEDYQEFLDKIYEIWYQMALTFPQVDVWEIGNETNHTYIKYVDYTYVSYDELAAINTDMLYYAFKAIKDANPKAKVITPGFAPVSSYHNSNTNNENEDITKVDYGIDSIAIFLDKIYNNIKSGSYPYHNNSKYVNEYKTDPDYYFDGVAYHPYDIGTNSNSNQDLFCIHLHI